MENHATDDELRRMTPMPSDFDGDESFYEWLEYERDQIERIEAHARAPEDGDFD